jgi:hypothetical protein
MHTGWLEKPRQVKSRGKSSVTTEYRVVAVVVAVAKRTKAEDAESTIQALCFRTRGTSRYGGAPVTATKATAQ